MSITAFSFPVIYLPLFSFTDQEGIAEAIRFGIARKIIELLGSATFKEIGSTVQLCKVSMCKSESLCN